MTDLTQPHLEYERRFLVADATILDEIGADFQWIDQGYIWAKEGYAIRIRLIGQGDEFDTTSDEPGILTLKGPRHDATRFELEQLVPANIAHDLLRLANFRVSKKRYSIIDHQETWVIDEFTGHNEGLILAEFEASEAAVKAVHIPEWCGEEISGDHRYDNENLARAPFRYWNTE